MFSSESVQDGSYRGRYSVIGMLPDLIWKSIKSNVYVKEVYKSNNYTKVSQRPLLSLKSMLKKSKINFPSFLPPMSTALIGYLGYETIEQFEKIPKKKLNELKLPDGFFIRPTIMAIFDNLKIN